MEENGGCPRQLELSEILGGLAVGCCGAAIIVRRCIARSPPQNGSIVRTLQVGQLVQVYQNYDSVYFSVVEVRGQDFLLDQTCLTAGQTDIRQVPGPIWAALFALEAAERALFVQTRQLERYAEIRIGSAIDVITDLDENLATATVVYMGLIPGRSGLHYGIRLSNNVDSPWELAHSISVLPEIIDGLPADCQAVVTIRQIQPPGSIVHRLDFPKSNSHDALKSAAFCPPPSRRQASRSLDLSSSAVHSSSGNHLSKIHSTSRSLEISSGIDRRLGRGRACSSLDSDNSFVAKELRDSKYDDLTIGSLIEIRCGRILLYGVIHWIGIPPEMAGGPVMAGVELEKELEEDSSTHGLFDCPPYRALFVPLSLCSRDSRFQDKDRRTSKSANNAFGQIDCPIVEGTIPPITRSLTSVCGKNRGIQGHHNSCYLDATLFAMFAFTSVFDSLLYRPPNSDDVAQYEEVQCVLRDEIVNPLRKNLFVRADRVMKLRTLLEELSSVTGLTSEEKDPEEFLNSLLTQILKAEPFLQLSSGHEAFHHQLFVEKDESLGVPSVQQLLEQSFLASDIKLKQLPPCLIIQMPRFGKAFKMYPRILPSTTLDVTDVIDNSPRQCTVCGDLAELECRDCYLAGLEESGFCGSCLDKAHNHPSRRGHTPRRLTVPAEFRELQEHCAVPRLVMNLFAVVCIETSHYVSFLKTDRGWVFFDSMADRKGEQNGYNIPEIVACPELPAWLSQKGLPEVPDDRQLPELAKRLLCDAYMCMYQSPEVLMYR